MTVTAIRPIKVDRILSSDDMCAFLESLGEDAIVACDTEGTNIELDYRDGTGYGVGISFAFRFGQVLGGYYPIRHPGDNLEPHAADRLRNAIRSFKGWLVFHNAKHDLVALDTLGIKYMGKFYDTLLLCHLLNETLPYDKSLNSCCKYYMGQESQKDDAILKTYLAALHQQWHLVPANIMAPYATHDAVLTLGLFEAIRDKVFKEVTTEYWDHKQKFIRAIIKMEGRGIKIDPSLCSRQAAIGEVAMAEAVELLGLNPGSRDDLEELFIDRMQMPVVKRSKKTQKPSFDKEAMAYYDDILEFRKDSTAQLVLMYRGWHMAVTSNYRPYLRLVSRDGRLRCNFKLHGTKTGRSSCTDPNLQQIPRISNHPWNGKLKHAFIPEEGYTLWEADFSQLEFSLGTAYAAQYQPDIPLIEIFNDPNRDVFTEMSRIEEWPRQHIKTRTYAIQYGGGANRLKNVFGLATLEEGAAIKDKFFEMYPGFKSIMEKASGRVRTRGKLNLWTGRYRHFMFPSDE